MLTINMWELMNIPHFLTFSFRAYPFVCLILLSGEFLQFHLLILWSICLFPRVLFYYNKQHLILCSCVQQLPLSLCGFNSPFFEVFTSDSSEFLFPLSSLLFTLEAFIKWSVLLVSHSYWSMKELTGNEYGLRTGRLHLRVFGQKAS